MALPPKPFRPRNWYWIVNGSTTQVYSSAVGNYVPVGNAPYLGEVLATHSLRPTPAAILDGYTETQAVKLTIETVAKILFNHENRIRTLAGQQPVNAAQFKAFIKSQM
jgi:hypothetical protein